MFTQFSQTQSLLLLLLVHLTITTLNNKMGSLCEIQTVVKVCTIHLLISLLQTKLKQAKSTSVLKGC